MNRFSTLILAIITAVLPSLTGCGEEEIATPQKKQPAGYIELIEAYEAGRVFSSAETSSDYCIVSFEDGYSIKVIQTEMAIKDHRNSTPPSVMANGGWWMVANSTLPIEVDSSLSDKDAWPVYVYFDELTLYMHLSNRHLLKFPSVALEEIEKQEQEIARYQNIPVVRIVTDAGAGIYDKKNYVPGTITITDPERLYSDVETFTGRMGIRGRGNSTWSFPKKPWKVKLDEKASIFGMAADKEWCLLANYSDRTLLRNVVAMHLSGICGFSWTPYMYSVEVYLNDEYQGVYTFCEHKKVSEARVDIDVDAGDVYLEIEQQQDETTCWWTGMGVPMMFSDPEEPSAELLSEVKQWFADFESSLYSSSFADPEKGYAAYIDVDSFIDYYIVQELAKNTDGNLRKSSFITKKKGGKLEMYHLWDFDLTFGNSGWLANPEGFYIKDYKPDCSPGDNWYNRMFRDPAFAARVKARWNELLPQLNPIPDFIDRQALCLDKAQKRNFEVWNINEVVDWVGVPSLGSYEKEVEAFKDFYTRRVKWLTTELNKL